MNRLIIIGNGFDLAHGLKTSYEDFLIDYFKKVAINSLYYSDLYEDDEFIDGYSSENYDNRNIETIFSKIKTIEELLNNNFIFISFSNDNWRRKIFENRKPIYFCVKNLFFKSLLQSNNWTDIESFYFQKLTIEFNKSKRVNQYARPNPKELNQEFSILKNKIYSYLEEQNAKSEQLINSKYQEFIDSMFRDINNLNDNVIFLNFNFTRTLNHYTKLNHQIYHDVINIHGSLNNPNSLIFGYGDDSHKLYPELEDSEVDDYLIKMHIVNFTSN